MEGSGRTKGLTSCRSQVWVSRGPIPTASQARDVTKPEPPRTQCEVLPLGTKGLSSGLEGVGSAGKRRSELQWAPAGRVGGAEEGSSQSCALLGGLKGSDTEMC